VHSADGVDLAEFFKNEDFLFLPVISLIVSRRRFLQLRTRGFYSHHGFDVKGILRALRRNISASSVVEGGSTITQQLAKMLIKNPERSFQENSTRWLSQ